VLISSHRKLLSVAAGGLASYVVRRFQTFATISANSGLLHRSKHHHSLTLSASASNFGGTSIPSALADLRLIASSKFVA
jgi:hypothetical protein